MTLEQGRPIAQSRLEILRGCDIIEWDATEGRRVYGRVIPSEPGMRNTVLRQPIGVVAAFSPWNFPMSSPARKVAGALSSGCAIILNPGARLIPVIAASIHLLASNGDNPCYWAIYLRAFACSIVDTVNGWQKACEDTHLLAAMPEKARSQRIRHQYFQRVRRRFWVWSWIDLAQPKPTAHDAAFRSFLNEMKQAAKPTRLINGADIGPYGRANLRVCETGFVEDLAWVAEINAQFG